MSDKKKNYLVIDTDLNLNGVILSEGKVYLLSEEEAKEFPKYLIDPETISTDNNLDENIIDSLDKEIIKSAEEDPPKKESASILKSVMDKIKHKEKNIKPDTKKN